MPENIPAPAATYENMEAKSASADAIKDLVGLMITLTIGVTAIVGFAIKDGFGSNTWKKSANPLLVAIFVYFIARVVVYAYDTYAAIAVQLDLGYLFIRRLESLVVLQAESLTFAAALAFVILSLNLISTDK